MAILRLYGNFRELSGVNELRVSGTSVRAVLNDAVRQIPAMQSPLLGNGELGSEVVLILHGLNVTDVDVPVGEDDILAVFPPIAGG